jgi:hypothetical protein
MEKKALTLKQAAIINPTLQILKTNAQIIPTTQEVEVGGLRFKASPGKSE